MNTPYLLSLILLLPLAGAGIIMLMRKESVAAIKSVGLAVSGAAFVASAVLFTAFDGTQGGMQFVEKVPWIPSLDVSYHLGVDGISLLLVVLTTFLTPIALLASWESIASRIKAYVALMLLLEVGTLGVFLSLDLFLFYVFWEFMLIPMYFIIGIWGGQERMYAAVKFFLYHDGRKPLDARRHHLARLLRSGPARRRVHHGPAGPLPGRPDHSNGASRPGCSWPSRSASPSRSRSFRSTPGCPTPTSRPRRRGA